MTEFFFAQHNCKIQCRRGILSPTAAPNGDSFGEGIRLLHFFATLQSPCLSAGAVSKQPRNRPLRFHAAETCSRSAATLLELVIVMTILGVLLSFGIPSFQLAIEQSRAQVASANLEAIWSAQRLYWLANRTYAPDLATLQSAGMLDPSLGSQTFFIYEIASADANTFVATATRVSNVKWNGTFTIDQSGTLSGVLSAPPQQNITAGFE